MILLIVNGFIVFYAQELRYPSLTLLLVALILHVQFRFEEQRAVRVLLTGILSALLAYSFYLGIFCLAGFTLYYLGAAVRNKSARPGASAWFLSMVLAAVLYLPWVARLQSQSGRLLAFVGWRNVLEHLSHFPFGAFFHVFWEFDGLSLLPNFKPLLFGLFLLWSLLALVGLIRLYSHPLIRAWLIATIFTLILTWLLMLTVGLYFMPKYFLMFAPVYYLCVARGLHDLFRARLIPAAVAAVLISGLSLAIFDLSAGLHPDFRDVIRSFNRTSPHDVILIDPAYQTTLFETFYTGHARLIPVPRPYDKLRESYFLMPKVTPADLSRLDTVLDRADNIYAFYGLGNPTRLDPKGILLKHLQRRFPFADVFRFYNGHGPFDPPGAFYLRIKTKTPQSSNSPSPISHRRKFKIS